MMKQKDYNPEGVEFVLSGISKVFNPSRVVYVMLLNPQVAPVATQILPFQGIQTLNKMALPFRGWGSGVVGAERGWRTYGTLKYLLIKFYRHFAPTEQGDIR